MPLGTRKLKLALQYPAGVSLFPKIVSVRAPGDSCYFAVSKIVESLLRRGARWFERTGLKPAGLRLRRGGGASRHPVLPVLRKFLTRQARFECRAAPPAKHPTGAPRGRAHRAFYWPSGREKRALSARLGDSFYFAKSEIVESLLRRGARWFERTGLKPAGLRLRRGGGASRHPVLPVLRKFLTRQARFECRAAPPAKYPTGAPRRRCFPALGIGHPGEKRPRPGVPFGTRIRYVNPVSTGGAAKSRR